jgi:hypothetical protein
LTATIYHKPSTIKCHHLLPGYVALANSGGESAEAEHHAVRIKHQPRPSWFQPTRFFGSYIVSSSYGFIAARATPIPLVGLSGLFAFGCLSALGVAFAVWKVGNVGLHSGRFYPTLAGAAVGAVLDVVVANPQWTFLFAFGAFSRTREWRGVPDAYLLHTYGGDSLKWFHRGIPGKAQAWVFFRALAVLATWMLYISACWGSFYYHGSITDEHGKTHRVYDCVNNILNSPAWKDFSFNEAYEHFTFDDNDDSWKDAWDEFGQYIRMHADVGGEKGARDKLGVSYEASWSEIKKAHRALAVKLHPDKGGNEADFREMQEAYDLLKIRREERIIMRNDGEL